MNNSINNFMINKPIYTQNSPEQTKKTAPNFDIEKELNNRTFIKPLKPKGKLLKASILNTPSNAYRDLKYNARALKHAIKGDANDHELGKLNDVGLFLGGLSIASYLATRRQTPMTKGMEFVGLASFLASMAIWPKIAIQLPAYLIHGVNVQKQYEDSFGRKKPFYQDPQFIPWDLYSDKDIEKIGNRLGVDKNIPNRREAIQEKMKKIAIQNNTLWMLTAGFATPIMSGLICNLSEPYINKILDNRNNKQADNILLKLDEHAKKLNKNDNLKSINKIIELYKNKNIDSKLRAMIIDKFTEGMDIVTAESFKKDLNNLLFDKTFFVNETNAKHVSVNITKALKERNIPEDCIKSIVPNKDEMIELFKKEGILHNNIEEGKVKTITLKLRKIILERLSTYNNNSSQDVSSRLIEKVLLNQKLENLPIRKAMLTTPGTIFTPSIQSKLRDIANVLDDFNAKNQALDTYALKKVGAAPETVIANHWNESASSLLKAIGFNNEEIDKVKFDRNVMGALLRDKIETIVSDDTKFEKFMKQLAEKLNELNGKIKASDISSPLLRKEDIKPDYDKKVETEFHKFADTMRQKGFNRTAKAIVGEGTETGTYLNVQKSYVHNRMLGVKSAFYRLINTFDFYRRVATNPNIMQALKGQPREVKEELIELCKIITLQGHSSDFATKFYMHRNPHPEVDGCSDVEVKNGKVINKFFGKTAETVDIQGDKYFYQNAMRMMFEEGMDSKTLKILESCGLKDELLNYRDLSINKLGGEYYFAKPRHLIRAQNGTSSKIKFLLTGITPEEFFYNSLELKANTNKWLKTFGTAGAALLGATVLAQFFFGKMKTPESRQK